MSDASDMNYFAAVLLAFASSAAFGKECAAPPVVRSGQAVCYATLYAEKNGLQHAPLNKKASKGRTAWTVSFTDNRANARNSGWQVDVDTASGTVTRFAAYKKPER